MKLECPQWIESGRSVLALAAGGASMAASDKGTVMRHFIPIAAFCSLLCTSCADERNGPLTPAQAARVRVLDTDLPLPPTASNVWLHEVEFLDAIQMVRFDAPIVEARTFARRALGHEPVTAAGPSLRGLSNRDWWLDGMPTVGDGGSSENVSRSVRIVLVPRGANARVWLAVAAD